MNQVYANENSMESLKNTARMLYLAHGACFFFSLGMFNLIPLIINYIKRDDAYGTFVYSHHSWMIASFWYYIGIIVIGWIFAVTLLGIPLAFIIWGIAWLFEAYRLIRGFVDLNNNREML
jgi:uncharacterized membrane protein